MDNRDDQAPIISIGMPVYNGEKTIRSALDSVLAQTIGNFELIISDNASTDGTEIICREYSAIDSRIRYVRQLNNIGAPKNFKYVLDESHCQYFMWATSDDVRSIDFLERNYFFLENNPDYVASTSPVRFEGGDFNPLAMGDASLTGSLPNRIVSFFSWWHANGRYCSLMRTNVIKKSAYVQEDFLGSDWAAMLSVIRCGKTNRHDQGFVVLGRDGFSNSENILKYYRRTWIHWFLPFLELIGMVLNLSAQFPLRFRIMIIGSLVKLNMWAIRISISKKIAELFGRLIRP